MVEIEFDVFFLRHEEWHRIARHVWLRVPDDICTRPAMKAMKAWGFLVEQHPEIVERWPLRDPIHFCAPDFVETNRR